MKRKVLASGIKNSVPLSLQLKSSYSEQKNVLLLTSHDRIAMAMFVFTRVQYLGHAGSLKVLSAHSDQWSAIELYKIAYAYFVEISPVQLSLLMTPFL